MFSPGPSEGRVETEPRFDTALVNEQHRRIAAFDSVVRSIDTDSLYKLWHWSLTLPDPKVGAQQVECEIDRILYRYGVPATAAALRHPQFLAGFYGLRGVITVRPEPGRFIHAKNAHSSSAECPGWFVPSDGAPRSYPTHRTTGSLGYFGKRASVNDRWHM